MRTESCFGIYPDSGACFSPAGTDCATGQNHVSKRGAKEIYYSLIVVKVNWSLKL